MLNYFLVFITQVTLALLRVIDVKVTYDNNILASLTVSLISNICWLVSTAIGISALINGEVGMIITYMTSALIGKYLGFMLYKVIKKKNKLNKEKLID